MATTYPIGVGRIYDPPPEGARILIDRLWPRGVRKEALHYDLWPKAAAPGNELRKWFHEDRPGRWEQFRRQYAAQLDANAGLLDESLALCRRGPVTVITSDGDPHHSHAQVLRDWLAAQVGAA